MVFAVQVHALQASLHRKGYYCGEDDAVWWQFGMDTQSSLTTFQVQVCYWPESSLRLPMHYLCGGTC